MTTTTTTTTGGDADRTFGSGRFPDFCRCCRARQNPGSNFSIRGLPVLFFRLSNFGMYSVVAGRPIKTFVNVSRRCRTNRKFINYNRVIERLVQVFIFGVLLTIVRAPTVMSAPTSCREWDEMDDSNPKWKNPCPKKICDDSPTPVSASENDQSITLLLMTASIADSYTRNFTNIYVRETFGKNESFEKSRNLHWLPNRETEVPKMLGDKTEESHLQEQILEAFLPKIYRAMQKYAVGLEQIVSDQKRTNGKFLKQFTDTEFNLRQVLCEIRSLMAKNNIKPSGDVERCIMDDHARRIDDTAQRNLRDWIILKEFLNGLEYLMAVLEYLHANSPS